MIDRRLVPIHGINLQTADAGRRQYRVDFTVNINRMLELGCSMK